MKFSTISNIFTFATSMVAAAIIPANFTKVHTSFSNEVEPVNKPQIEFQPLELDPSASSEEHVTAIQTWIDSYLPVLEPYPEVHQAIKNLVNLGKNTFLLQSTKLKFKQKYAKQVANLEKKIFQLLPPFAAAALEEAKAESQNDAVAAFNLSEEDAEEFLYLINQEEDEEEEEDNSQVEIAAGRNPYYHGGKYGKFGLKTPGPNKPKPQPKKKTNPISSKKSWNTKAGVTMGPVMAIYGAYYSGRVGGKIVQDVFDHVAGKILPHEIQILTSLMVGSVFGLSSGTVAGVGGGIFGGPATGMHYINRSPAAILVGAGFGTSFGLATGLTASPLVGALTSVSYNFERREGHHIHASVYMVLANLYKRVVQQSKKLGFFGQAFMEGFLPSIEYSAMLVDKSRSLESGHILNGASFFSVKSKVGSWRSDESDKTEGIISFKMGVPNSIRSATNTENSETIQTNVWKVSMNNKGTKQTHDIYLKYDWAYTGSKAYDVPIPLSLETTVEKNVTSIIPFDVAKIPKTAVVINISKIELSEETEKATDNFITKTWRIDWRLKHKPITNEDKIGIQSVEDEQQVSTQSLLLMKMITAFFKPKYRSPSLDYCNFITNECYLAAETGEFKRVDIKTFEESN